MYKDKCKIKLKGGVFQYALAACAASAIVISPLHAQDENASDEAMEEVTVTGSRIRRANLTSTSPVTQVDADEFLYQGITRVEDLLNDLPQVFATQTSGQANGATGTATVDLRGLDAVRTLTLLDGRRLPMGSPTSGGTASDLNQIPAGLIEKVEVLTGGASATYGSDAIAGVVNFITKKDFEGIRIDYQHSFYHHKNDNDVASIVTDTGFELPDSTVSDGNTDDISLLMGINTSDGRGNMTAYATYRNIEAITQSERDYSACALSGSPDDFSCGGSSTIPNGRFTDFGVLAAPPCVMVPDPDNPREEICNEIPEFDPETGIATGNVGTDLNDDPCVNSAGVDIPCVSNEPIGPWFGSAGGGSQLWPGSFDYLVVGDQFVDRSGHPLALYNYAPSNYYQRPDKRTTFGTSGHYEFSEKAKVYLQLNFMDDRSVAQIAPSGAFFVTDSLSCNNPLLSAQQRSLICTPYNLPDPDPTLEQRQTIFLGRRNVEGGFRADDIRHTSYRTVIGLDGQINDKWSYDVFANFSTVSFVNTYQNDLSATRIARALDVIPDPDTAEAVCQSVVDGSDPNCVPWNIFEEGGVTQEAIDYLVLPLYARGETKQTQIVGYVAGELDAKLPSADNTIAVVAGYEFRKEELVFQPDNGFSSGDGAGQGGPIQGVEGDFDVSEIFGEINIPITSTISTEAGFRSSDYSTDKSTTTYKIGGEYQVIDSLRLRMSVQRAVRAGNLRELYRPETISLFDMDNDPCAGASPTATQAQCANTGVTADQYGTIADSPAGQYNYLQGGNTNLDPEESDTFSIGAVWTGDKLSLTIDYFDIEIQDAIDNIDPEFTLNQCLETGNAFYCNFVTRGSTTGTLWVGQDNIRATDINIGFKKTSGFDIQASYDLELSDKGDLKFSFVGTLLQTWDEQNVPDSPVVDCVGKWGGTCAAPKPKWVHNLRTTWATPWDASISLSWRHIGGVDDTGDNMANFGSQNYLDISALWQASEHVNVRFGINNLLDRDPPLTGDAGPSIFGNGNTFPGVYDALGQYIFMGVSLQY